MHTSLVKKTYSLSIRICSDGFSLFIHNEKNLLISSRYAETSGFNYAENLRFWLMNQNEIQEEYGMVRVFIESDFYSLIPDVFFDEEHNRSLLLMHHPSLPRTHELINLTLIDQHAVFLFAIDSQLINILNEKIHSFEALPHFYPVIKKIRTTSQDNITLWIRGTKMDACVCKNNQFQLLNTFPIETEEDLVYHTLNLYDQLNLNIENALMEVYTTKSDLPLSLLQKYVPVLTIKSIQSEYENYKW